MELWHGSSTRLEGFDEQQCRRLGIHCGSREQARMRCGKGGHLHLIEAPIERQRRCRDSGGNWSERIARARRDGCDAIIYLNRYEGLPTERIVALAGSGQLSDLDSLTDAAFRKLVPEAQDSLILLCDPSLVRIIEIEGPTRRISGMDDGPASAPSP